MMEAKAIDAEIRKHPALYFDDGDIELVARTADDSSTQLFKVHRTTLSRASPVFRDMFAVSGDRQEAVSMSDTAEDLSDLLQCISNGWLVIHMSTR